MGLDANGLRTNDLFWGLRKTCLEGENEARGIILTYVSLTLKCDLTLDVTPNTFDSSQTSLFHFYLPFTFTS
jgi:hypothetical protein